MAIDVRRRKFIAVLSGALVGRAIPAYAQQAARTYTVGVLMGFANDAEAKARVQAFEQGLEREGWSVGQNLRIEYRYAEGDSVRMQALAKEVVEVKPDCILGHSTPVLTALMKLPGQFRSCLCPYPIQSAADSLRALHDLAAT